MNRIAIACIKVYRLVVSPWLAPSCRFHPSCSCYAQEAFQKKNFFYASVVTVKRILKCNPFHEGGFDPLK